MDGLQETLQQASKIKMAQLKIRPGRQQWELAPDFFKRTAFFMDGEDKAVREGTLSEKFTRANELKEQGNASFGQMDAQGALLLYTRAIGLFMWFDRGPKRDAEDIPLVNTLDDSRVTRGMPEEEVERARQLASACFSNVALCLLKLDKVSDAIYACNKALELDKWNVRALYRRAEGLYCRGGSTSDLEMCVEDLKEALKLEPGNAQVRQTLAQRQTELREQCRKDKQAFSGMFQSGSLYEEGEAFGMEVSKASKLPDARSGEVNTALSDIQRSLATVKGKAGAKAAGHGGQAGLPQRPQRSSLAGSVLAPLAHVPWWGWVLIVLHLAYRIQKNLHPAMDRFSNYL